MRRARKFTLFLHKKIIEINVARRKTTYELNHYHENDVKLKRKTVDGRQLTVQTVS